MTLEQAMALLTAIGSKNILKADRDTLIALTLGIEAMKRIYRQRRNTIPINQPLLPGEHIV